MKFLIQEMPSLNPNVSPYQDFDFELEGRSGISILNLLIDIFSGKPVKDKFGNILQISNVEEKEAISRYIKEHPQTGYNWMVSKMDYLQKELLDKLLQ